MSTGSPRAPILKACACLVDAQGRLLVFRHPEDGNMQLPKGTIEPGESPEIAAARCSDTQDLAVPGTPSRSSARSVASVATAVSISRRLPKYFDVIGPPFTSPPMR